MSFKSLSPVFLSVYSRDFNNDLILGFIETAVEFNSSE